MKPKFCRYCRRGPLLTPGSGSKIEFTRDHVKAKTRGGFRTVSCCRQCNMLKADMLHEEWFWFVAAFPRYWKTFANHMQVREVIIAERTRRAFAGEKPIVSMLMGSKEHPPPGRITKYELHIMKEERQENG